MNKLDESMVAILNTAQKDIVEQCSNKAQYKFTIGDTFIHLACQFHIDYLATGNLCLDGFNFKKLIEIELSYGHKCECLQLKEKKGR